MQLRRLNHIQEFWNAAQVYLQCYEAEHNSLLGICQTLLNHPSDHPEPPYFAIVEGETVGEMIAIALRTPPYKLVLSKTQDLAAVTLIAQDLAEHQPNLPGVGGLVVEVAEFLAVWRSLTGQGADLTMSMAIHQLTSVEPVATASGTIRLATEQDRPLLRQWFEAFIEEAIAGLGTTAESLTDRALEQRNAYLWEDPHPVSLVCGYQFSPTAARIGPVYTPQTERRKGYATASVAALSQQFLDQGCQRCFLFTDLANPTSNHIYQAIGYQRLCDWQDYRF